MDDMTNPSAKAMGGNLEELMERSPFLVARAALAAARALGAPGALAVNGLGASVNILR